MAGERVMCRIYQLWVRLGVWRDLLQLVAGKLGILMTLINNRKKGRSYHHFSAAILFPFGLFNKYLYLYVYIYLYLYLYTYMYTYLDIFRY